MLATMDAFHRAIDSTMDEKQWIDDHRIRIPWFNDLTAQSIPEETERPKRQHTDSGCSSPSSEDAYVVLEFQRPRSITTDVELNFEDEHYVEYDQLAEPILIPVQENAVKHSFEFEYATVIDSPEQISHNRPLTFSTKSIEQTTPSTRTSAFDPEQCFLPSLLRQIKKRCRVPKYEYDFLTHEMKSDEPVLLRIRYFDGRPTLIDLNVIESSRKSQTSRNLTRDRPTSSSTDQSKSWRQKTIFELLNERKTKRNRS